MKLSWGCLCCSSSFSEMWSTPYFKIAGGSASQFSDCHLLYHRIIVASFVCKGSKQIRFLEAILRPFRILGDIHFQMHFFICTRFAQKSLSRNSAGQECPLSIALSTAGRLCEKKKRRTRAKPPRPPAGKNFRSLILETSLPRRLGVVHNFFAPTSAGRPAYRRQVFVRKKEKIIRRPVILRGRLQSREGAKSVRLSAAGRPWRIRF